MIVYLPEDIVFTIDLQTVNCLTSITLEDVIDIKDIPLGDIRWSRRQGTIQSWQITLEGEGQEGYTLLRGLFRSRTAADISISTTDNEIVQTGSAIVIDIRRDIDASEDSEKFSAFLLGIGVIDATIVNDFLLIETGDYLLQENASRIII